MGTQHSLLMFEESIKSEISRKKYVYLVKLFMEYHKIKDFDSIVKIDKKELQKLIETYVIHVKKNVNPNTVPTYLVPVRTFLEINDIELNWRKIKRFYPGKIKPSGASAYQTKDVKLMLEVTPQIRNKALIHFLSSSGVRVGSINELKIKHLRDMPHGCTMVLIYEDSTEEYHTFLTPEATKSLNLYLDERKKQGEILDEDSPIFRERYQIASAKSKALSTEAIQAVLARTMKNASLRGQKKNGRYSEQLVHGFRKRFNTILKLNNDVNDNAIEKMMGHKKGLDGSYLQITTERLFEEFKKGIMDLTIDSTERQKTKIETLESKQAELENLQEHMENIISEKIKHQSTKLLKDLEKIMENSSKKVQMKMERGDLKLFKGMSKNGAEFEKMKSSYHNKN